jgi:diguanylate cyclase (GGDEF)-like protein/PAS domain S-box-containing protein
MLCASEFDPLRRPLSDVESVQFLLADAGWKRRPLLGLLDRCGDEMDVAMLTEERRLAALRELDLLDTEREQEFDELVRLASQLCETPIALFSLVAEDRQWFKASHGLDTAETPRCDSFCSVAILTPTSMMIVADTLCDERFAKNALVLGSPNIRFYAGMPILAPHGEPVGTLCVIDLVPRTLTEEQQSALEVLSRQIRVRLEMRGHLKMLRRVLANNEAITASLRTSQNRFEAFMEHSPFISYMKDEDGRLLYYNRRYAERFGIDEQGWIGLLDEERHPPETAAKYRAHDLTVLSGSEAAIHDTTFQMNGKTLHWRSHKFPFRNAEGRLLLGGISVDMTAEQEQHEAIRHYQQELQEANQRLQQLSVTDPLTGLGNRRFFDERLSAELSTARRYLKPLSMLMIDIDNFKQRNDTFGHLDGDYVLRELGALMRRIARRSDIAVRYGGEEFAILLPNTSEISALEFASRLQEQLSYMPWDHQPVTASIGIASTEQGIFRGEYLVQSSDSALYAAKHAGKNCIRTYSSMHVHQLLVRDDISSQ